MKPKLLSWNVRGLNDGDKRLRVRNLLREWKVDIVCFQETKLEVISRNVIRSLWGCHHVNWCYLDSRRASDGILIMWDRRVMEKIDVCVWECSLAITFRNVEDQFTWAFAGIYGPNSIWIEGSLGRVGWITQLVEFALVHWG
jgi:exonuclease III